MVREALWVQAGFTPLEGLTQLQSAGIPTTWQVEWWGVTQTSFIRGDLGPGALEWKHE